VKAVVFRQPGVQPEVEDLTLDPPGPGEVEVRVEAAGVCHTELHYMRGEIPCRLPVVLGHEGSGVVEAVGAAVDGVVVGDRVAFTWRPRCGHCEACIVGRPVMCRYGRVQAQTGGLMDGTSRLRRGYEAVHHFLGVSCFAERAVVSQRAVVKVTADVPAPVAAVAGCAVITGLGAVINVGGQVAGRSLLIIGAGGVGLSALMGATLAGARPVIVVDIGAAKLDLAVRLGAAHVLDASSVRGRELVEAVHELSGGGVEVAIDAAGRPETLRQAFSGSPAVSVGVIMRADGRVAVGSSRPG
jgi:Zn-dependent alcohol dehydrogenase